MPREQENEAMSESDGLLGKMQAAMAELQQMKADIEAGQELDAERRLADWEDKMASDIPAVQPFIQLVRSLTSGE